MALLLVSAAVVYAGPAGDNDLPLDPEWLANTGQRGASVGSVQNNVVPGAVAARDAAVASCPKTKDACRPEYAVIWMGKQNAGDFGGSTAGQFIDNATVNPQGLADLGTLQFGPGLDGFAVLDVRRENADGSRNPFYSKVVNFVQMPADGGVECEPHHMQYEWLNGQRIMAGCLFTDYTHVLDVKDIPNMSLVNSIRPYENPFGSVPDAYDATVLDPNGDGNHSDDKFVGTYMGGPNYNFAGSPGSLVSIDGSTGKQIAETRAGSEGQIFSDPVEAKVCSLREARPVGSCSNPHGIQARTDLGRMVTDDYAEPRELTTDPVKPVDKYAFRPTTRTWDISGANATAPKQVATAKMPASPKDPAQRAHVNIGIMEGAKTQAPNPSYQGQLESKGMFSEAMCGGGIFFDADVTQAKGDNSGAYKQVWDDGLTQLATSEKQDVLGTQGEFSDEPGGCAGGAWVQTSGDNRSLFRSVQGRVPLGDNYFDQGQEKMVYELDITNLIKDGQDGSIDECNLNDDLNGNGQKDFFDMAESLNTLKPTGGTGDQAQYKQTAKSVGSCPSLKDLIVVHDPTSGGPHWAALDNHSRRADGSETRLIFTNYFVGRLGVDGDHRAYLVDVDKDGNMTYDRAWRDEKTGALGINFNRRNWPNSPDAGFFKPHSTVWVCPPDVCTRDNN